MKSIEKAQNLLPLGYLFLVVLGILKESVFFHQIGINILKYSSIMDILISPIATLTLSPVILTIVFIMFAFHFCLPSILYRYKHKKWIIKRFELEEIKEEQSKAVLKQRFVNASVIILSVMLLSFFLGFGIGGGQTISKKIKLNKLSYNYKLNYNSGESEDIYLIESNSAYYFYMAKGNPAVKIAPVGAIKSIELTKNKMLD
jgi:hypothetical protein